MYTIKASFAGTNSYYNQIQKQCFQLIAEAETIPTASPIANPPYELYTIGMGAAIIVAFAIVQFCCLERSHKRKIKPHPTPSFSFFLTLT